MYEIKLLPSGRRDLGDLPSAAFPRVKEALAALGRNPRPIGCIKLTAEEGYRIRVGTYRILYRIEDKTKQVFIYRVKHRKEVYR
jgi:mRNA interferase RelE/StbE